ncbi:hypothetical protein [Vibrio sp. VB16]|uniref:hypothetical protein n=1 Tax=Vibrio sp. VB16 TaxID=2785746 RepID=UPI00189D7D59|nr:hypothetical protein [Vibrio sp. VB16]UGA53648.1 hypothetical protein IUZ65_010110 [Vibrio sp. VB16]
MNNFALIIGVFIACFIIFRFKKVGYEKRRFAYPALLMSFPIYYWLFALYANDYQALLNEVIVGLFFIILASLALRYDQIKSLVILAMGFIGHGVYDVVHLTIYGDSVAPLWWPEFCGSIDILLGVYLLWLAKKSKELFTPKVLNR